MGARFLDDEAHAAFKEAVEDIESASAVEVVVAMRRRSAGYLHANLIVGGVVAFAGLAAMLFASYPFGLISVLVDPFVVGAIAGGLVELLPLLKRLLTPASVRRRHVEHAARAAFVDRGVHNTTDRSGLLIYISWLEQQVALVADSNLQKAFTAEALHQAERDLTSAMPRGGTAVAHELARLETALASAMPRRAGDLNELPDAIDSDLSAGAEGAALMRRLMIALGLLALVAGLADARPGGGESYSGGGGHGGGGGGGSSGGGDGGGVFELVYWLIRLIIYAPQIGLPVLALVIGVVVYSAYKQQKNKDWDSGPPVTLKRAASLDPLRRVDPEFSQVLFEDFAFRLFATANRVRHSDETLATVAPYVSPAARKQLQTRTAGQPIESVVVGAMRTFRVDVPKSPVDLQGRPNRVRIGVEYEANVTTAKATYYTVETWLFGREATRLSKPPGASKGFPCPSCGAPWQANASGTQVCASCGEVVDNGRFDWMVEQVSLSSSDQRPPTVTEDVEERGTDLQTYRQADVDRQWASLEADDPALTEQNLVARLNLIFKQLTEEWSANELLAVRGLVSDGLFDYLQYWVDAYKKQGLRNQLADTSITHTIVAKVVRDRWFDAITIRIWAQGKDYVVRSETGKIVRGSKSQVRKYTEYWTLIRSRARTGAPNAAPTCSNCGAPLKITMAGECEHCNAHVTAGEFDWVLSKIEQDDTYRG